MRKYSEHKKCLKNHCGRLLFLIAALNESSSQQNEYQNSYPERVQQQRKFGPQRHALSSEVNEFRFWPFTDISFGSGCSYRTPGPKMEPGSGTASFCICLPRVLRSLFVFWFVVLFRTLRIAEKHKRLSQKARVCISTTTIGLVMCWYVDVSMCQCVDVSLCWWNTSLPYSILSPYGSCVRVG